MKLQRQFLIIFLLAFLLFIQGCANTRQSTIVQGRRGSGSTLKQKSEELPAEKSTGEEAEKEEQDQGELTGLYLFRKFNRDNKTVSLVKLSDGKSYQYPIDTATMFLDKYGGSKSQASFISGEAVEMEVDTKKECIKKLWVSDRVWVQEDITNYSVAEGAHAVTIGKTKYTYDEDMPVFSQDIRVEIGDLILEDEIRAVGIGKKLLSLSITRGHGYLVLANTKLFDGSFICIGDKIFEEVKPDKKITVPEGKHLVTVANDGYGGSKEVTIERGMTESLDLDKLKGEGPKTCKITFHVGVEGAVLQIDDKTIDYSKPVEVRYGVHSIAVGAEGYDTVKQKLVVNSKDAEIEIGLTKTDTSSQAENAADSNTGNNSNQNTNNNSNNNSYNNSGQNTNNNSNYNTNNNNSDNGNNSGTGSSTDYLTTLYNLLTSVNENNNNKNNQESSTNRSHSESNTLNGILDTDDDLIDQ